MPRLCIVNRRLDELLRVRAQCHNGDVWLLVAPSSAVGHGMGALAEPKERGSNSILHHILLQPRLTPV